MLFSILSNLKHTSSLLPSGQMVL